MSERLPGSVRCLLVSVGGTPEPVAFSIEYHRPEKVIFFASRSSRAEIETKIRPLTSYRWADQEVITTPDHQDLMCCMETLVVELPRVLDNLGVAASELLVDYTGGTKTMSAALVLATIHEPVRYSYVGGNVRSKGGLGVVLDGTEALVMAPNPWDVLAVELRARFARQFNAGHFVEAKETALQASERVSERWRPLFAALRELCEGYWRWNGFDYAGAVGPLKTGQGKLGQYALAAADQPLMVFVEKVRRDLERLERLQRAGQALQSGVAVGPEELRLLVIDLVRNALATMRLAGRADDAVARLYSALEKLAKAALLSHGIDNSATQRHQIPEPLQDEFVRKYGDGSDGPLKFGLLASYRLLDALGDPLGARFRAREKELSALLGGRNDSLMVHGWKPVKAEFFDRLLPIVLDFLGMEESALPSLPRFPE